MKTITVIITIIGVSAILGIGILLTNKEPMTAEAFLNDIKSKSVEEMTLYLDGELNEPEGFGAAITGQKLMVSDGVNQIEYDAPSNKFYLSFAPYINDTHPCANHNLVTCRGEMVNKTVNVYIEDASGNVIVNDDYTTFDNGFIGIWLPKNIEGEITVSYEGLTATESITTYESSNTCLTTLHLQ